MNEHLENQLRSMPTANLSLQDKKRIHDTLMSFEEHPVQRTWKKLKWALSTIGGLVAAALLAFFIWTVPQNPFTDQETFLGAEQLKEIEELNDVERAIKLPTYAPFKIDKIEFFQQYLGPKDFGNGEGEPTPLEPVDPKLYVQNISYLSNEEPFQGIHLIIADSNAEEVARKGYEPIELKDGITAYYFNNGNAQMMYWSDNGVNYHLNVIVENKDKTSFREEPIPIEEMIKIAESFRVYKK
ncbi:hypothetical protein V7138_11215 [Bacillus sp. JJ1533]|uniref:hypothetical protein n=1 Tax=Bacillus sp. JJ1533 TaxID=3122959 RepID=UPI002FFE319B